MRKVEVDFCIRRRRGREGEGEGKGQGGRGKERLLYLSLEPAIKGDAHSSVPILSSLEHILDLLDI